MVVRQLITVIGFKVNSAQLRGAEMAVRNTATSMAALGAQMSLALTLPIALIGKSFLTASDDIERTRIKLEAFTGSGAAAEKMLQDLFALADRSPFKVKDIGDIGGTLLARGTKPEELLGTLEMLGDIAAGVNGNLNLIGVNYSQVREKNILLSRDLREFANQGIPLMEALVKVTGRSQDILRGTGRVGKATFKEVEAAFKLMTQEGGKFHKMMEKIALGTISGRFSIFLDKLFRVSAEFGDMLKPIAMDTITFLIDSLKWIRTLSYDTKRFILIVGAVAAAIGPVILLVKLLSFVLSPIGVALTAILTAVSLIVDEFVVWKAGGDSLVGALLGNFDTFSAKMKSTFASVKSRISALAKEIKEAVKPILEEFAKENSIVIEDMLKSLGSIGERLKDSRIKEDFKDMLRSMKGIFVDFITGLVERALNSISGIFKTISGVFKILDGNVKEGIKDVFFGITKLDSALRRTPGLTQEAGEKKDAGKRRGIQNIFSIEGGAPKPIPEKIVPSPVLDFLRSFTDQIPRENLVTKEVLREELRADAAKRAVAAIEAGRRLAELDRMEKSFLTDPSMRKEPSQVNVTIGDIVSNQTDPVAVAEEVKSTVITEIEAKVKELREEEYQQTENDFKG